MFTLYNKNSHKFKNKKFYKIGDVLTSYEIFLNKKNIKHKNLIHFKKPSLYLTWILKYYQKNHELRCSICGCKANHFRLMKNNNFHLFGIKHDSLNNATYLFFNRDHIVPESLGGTLTKNNIRLTCERCNNNRGNDIKLINKAAFDNNNIYRFRNAIITTLGIGRSSMKKIQMKLSEYDKKCVNKFIKFLSNCKDNEILNILNKI